LTLAVSTKDSSKIYYYENLRSCSVGLIVAKAQEPNVNNGFDTSQNKTVNLTGQ
jgi:hypothetical protein